MILSLFCFCFGAIAGSFANALIYRIPQGLSFVKSEAGRAGRSMCPHCGHQLSALDLIPIVSWLYLRGRCRYCDQKIGLRYALLEVFTACLGVFLVTFIVDVVLVVYLFMIMPFFVTMVIIFLRYKDFSMIRFLGLIIVAISIVMFLLSWFI